MNKRLVLGVAAGLVFASIGPLLADVGAQSGRRLEAPPGSNHVRSDVRQSIYAYGTADLGTGSMDFLVSAWLHEQRIVADDRPYADELVDGRVTLSRQICMEGHECFRDRWTATVRDRSALLVDPPTGAAHLSALLDGAGPRCRLELASADPVNASVIGGPGPPIFSMPYRSTDTTETEQWVTMVASGSCLGGRGTITPADAKIWRRIEATPSPLREQRPGTIVTIAGVPSPGYEGDGGPARWAWLGYPSDVAASNDRIFIAEPPNRAIRRIDPDGTIHTHARISAKSIAFLPDGSLIASDGWQRVVRVNGYESTVTLVGGGASLGDGGDATQASLSYPGGIAVDRSGAIYIADEGHNRVRAVDSAGKIRTVAGTGTCQGPTEGIPATQAAVCSPTDVAVGLDGSVYIVEGYDKRVRWVSPDGRIQTLISPTNASVPIPIIGGTFDPNLQPEDVGVAPDGTAYVSFGEMIARLEPSGSWHPVAGKTHVCTYEGDGGPPLAAGMCGATGIAFDSVGRMVFADRWHHAIRRIDLTSPKPIP